MTTTEQLPTDPATLNRAIAREVLFLHPYPRHVCGAEGFGLGYSDTCPACEFTADPDAIYADFNNLPPFVAKIEAAWTVMDMYLPYPGIELRRYNDGWCAEIANFGGRYATLDTRRTHGLYSEQSASEAICRVALAHERNNAQD